MSGLGRLLKVQKISGLVPGLGVVSGWASASTGALNSLSHVTLSVWVYPDSVPATGERWIAGKDFSRFLLTYYAGDGESDEPTTVEVGQPPVMEGGQALLASLAPLRLAVTSAGGADASQLAAAPQGSAEAAVAAGGHEARQRVALGVAEPGGDDLGALVVDEAGGVRNVGVRCHQTSTSSA